MKVPGCTTDEYLPEMRDTMLENGWAVQCVASDRMPFAYRSATVAADSARARDPVD